MVFRLYLEESFKCWLINMSFGTDDFSDPKETTKFPQNEEEDLDDTDQTASQTQAQKSSNISCNNDFAISELI